MPVSAVAPTVLSPRGPVSAPRRSGVELSAESRAWVSELRGIEPGRGRAIAALHAQLCREAGFEVRRRATHIPELSPSYYDDVAVQAADDALMTLLRKLDDFRGDSQFWTWARRFVQIETSVSIRRYLGRDTLLPVNAPPGLTDPVALGSSPTELVEQRQLMREVVDLIINTLTQRQRTVLVAVAINGDSPARLAAELDTTPGAVYKTLHDARAKLKTQLALTTA